MNRDMSCKLERPSQPSEPSKRILSLERKVKHLLSYDGTQVRGPALHRFVCELDRSIRLRHHAVRFWSKACLNPRDIASLVCIAAQSGEQDEAVWRGFLAAHFGRSSASKTVNGQAESAAWFLCAFGSKPHWTWNRVTRAPEALRSWLNSHKEKLRTLSYGNHRKFESKKAEDILRVIDSFICLAANYGGPAGLLSTDTGLSPTKHFDVLYQRLKPLYRFGRTGRFDFLVFLADLKLVDVEPESCYLRGATGPLRGARRLWGKRISELEQLATGLAAKLRVSPVAMEDTLCNWQKG